jgi:hypothetical protein
MAVKAHLTQEGLEEIIRIKGSINKGLPAELSKAYSNIKQIDRPVYKAGDSLIDPL